MLFFKNFNPIFQQSKIYFIFQFSILLIKDHSPKFIKVLIHQIIYLNFLRNIYLIIIFL
jgi:hypothetical protein